MTSGPRGERGRAGVGAVTGCFPPPAGGTEPRVCCGFVCLRSLQAGRRERKPMGFSWIEVHSQQKKAASS